MEAAEAREDVLETEELEKLCAGIEEYDLEKAERIKGELAEGGYSIDKASAYIAKINERIVEIHTANLDAIIDGIEDMDKERLIQAQINVQNYGNGCPEELKSKYIASLESAASDIAEKEIKELCGNVSSLSVKKSQDIIRKLNTMSIDDDIKNRYVDIIDAHIASIKDNEAKDYIRYLSFKMDDFGVNSVHLSVPGLSNLFFNKYEAVSKAYISAGRYELPILLHEGNGGDGFTMTTEYLYTYVHGVLNRIKIDDIASFQAKKGLMSSSLIATEKNGGSNDLPNALNKNVIENVAKVLTALVCYINDKRSAEHMKDLLENAVQQEKAIHAEPVVIPTPAPEPAPVSEPEPAPVAEEPIPVSEPEPVVEAVPETKAEEVPEKPAEDEVKEDAPTEQAPVETAPTEEAPKAEVKIRFCDQCGAKIPNPNAKFCMECGNKLQQG
ncbi:MAG: zinc-ribbon domain-containing protein, partial [Oscillospiraceae bacterium]|nr:zinc-ribbon domain-containing protein [Oscillospiraceae bacterium]